MAITKRPLKQTADTEKAAEASYQRRGKHRLPMARLLCCFDSRTTFWKGSTLPPKHRNCHVRHWSGPLSLKPWRPKGFESEIMTSKLDELLSRQPSTPFVITTEDGDLISISNPPVRVSEAYGSSSHTA